MKYNKTAPLPANRLLLPAAVVCACLVLSGCPSASNPTTPQPPAPPAGGAASPSSGSSSPSSSSSSSSAGASASRSSSSSSSSSSASSSGSSPGAAGEFPQGEFPQGDSTPGDSTPGDSMPGDSMPGDVAGDQGEGAGANGTATAQGAPGEPGFENSPGGEPGFEPATEAGLPDMSDSPSFEDVLAGMEEAMGDGDGEPWGTGDGNTTGDENSQTGGSGTATGSGRGPLTTAEQVAVLDAQLERGTGEFDAMILEEQRQQREAARQGEAQAVSTGGTGEAGPSSSEYGRGSVASSGYGGGIGGGTGTAQIPQDTAKYPPPKDIPSGDDDDVVARQLREAAMREPDPAVREKLWDEYRKYKGIDP